MLNKKSLKLSKYQQISIIILSIMFGSSVTAMAKSLNAGFVMNEMTEEQRYGYISGVIEGLAYSRFLRDKPNQDGMNCVYNWYYEGGEGNFRKLDAWLNRHPDKQVGVLLYVLIKKECGA